MENYLLNEEIIRSHILVKVKWHEDSEGYDLFAILLNENNQILNDGDLVYYNSEIRSKSYDKVEWRNKRDWRENTIPMSTDGSVCLLDELNCFDYSDFFDSSSDHCEEIMLVNLSKVRPEIQKISFFFVVYDIDESRNMNELYRLVIEFIQIDFKKQFFEFEILKEPLNEKLIVVCTFVRKSENEWLIEKDGSGYSNSVGDYINQFVPFS